MDVLHVYVQLVVDDRDAAARFPRVATHLANCGACEEDFQGLLLAVIAADLSQ